MGGVMLTETDTPEERSLRITWAKEAFDSGVITEAEYETIIRAGGMLTPKVRKILDPSPPDSSRPTAKVLEFKPRRVS